MTTPTPTHLWIVALFDAEGRLCGRSMGFDEASARADAKRWASTPGQVATLNVVAVQAGERFGRTPTEQAIAEWTA